MLIYQILRVVSLLVFIGLLVLALLRPRTRQTLIVVGLVLSILATIPSLPVVSTALFQAFWHYDPQNRHVGYYAYVDLVNLALVAGAGLFGWAALTSSPRVASTQPWAAQQATGQWQPQPWDQPQQWQQHPTTGYPADQFPANQALANQFQTTTYPTNPAPQQYPSNQGIPSNQGNPSTQGNPTNQTWSGDDWQQRS